MALVTELSDFIESFNEPSLEVARILPRASVIHSFASGVPSTCETVMTSIRRKIKKSVHFRTVTVFYFPRMQGYCSIPSQDGPTLGMSNTHVHVETYDLMDRSEQGIDSLHSLVEHTRLKDRATRPAVFSDSVGQDNLSTLLHITVDPLQEKEEPCCVCLPAEQQKPVRSTIQPVSLRQRRKLLREAGVSKINAAEEAEAREIRISRTLCGCSCKVVCRPDTCLCSLSEIPCQVDSESFPCACSEISCGNLTGRLQFDPVQVKNQRILQLAQLQVESSVDNGDPAVSFLKVELTISPAKRTKLSKAENTRKRVASKKLAFRKKLGKQSSCTDSEKLERESIFEREEKLELRCKEADCEIVQREHLYSGRDKKDVPLKNKVTFSEEKILKFREPVQEQLNEVNFALESVDVALDTFQNELNSPSAEDVHVSEETTTSCTRGFDLDLEDDLDPNCLKVLVIGNENLEDTTTHICLGISNVHSGEDLGVKCLQSQNDVQLQSDLESESKRGFSLDPKNDFQPVLDIDLELNCEVVDSNTDLKSTDDLDVDLECGCSLNSGSLQPINNLVTECTSDVVECCGIKNSDAVKKEFTDDRDFDAGRNNLHNTFKIDSSVVCLHISNEQSIYCNSVISNFFPNSTGQTASSDLASGVNESPETCNKSQRLAESKGHIIKTEHHYIESQSHRFESQGQSIESQGHCSGELCCAAAKIKVEDFRSHGSLVEVIAVQEASGPLSKVLSAQPSTLENVSSNSQDLNEWQPSVNSDVHNNLDNDLMDFVCTGSILETDAVPN